MIPNEVTYKNESQFSLNYSISEGVKVIIMAHKNNYRTS